MQFTEILQPTARSRRAFPEHGGTSSAVGTGCSVALLAFFPWLNFNLLSHAPPPPPPVSIGCDWWSLRERKLQPPTDFIHPAWSHQACQLKTKRVNYMVGNILSRKVGLVHGWRISLGHEFTSNKKINKKSPDPEESKWFVFGRSLQKL